MLDEVIAALVDITGSNEVAEDPDVELFESGLLDSFATAELIVELEQRTNICIALTEFDRESWSTPRKIAIFLEAKSR